MNNLLGKKVVVFSQSGGQERQDIGVLQAVDGIWMTIKKSETETQYFCLYSVRMVKSFDN